MRLNLHLVSDATGETLEVLSRAVMSQFEGVEIKKFEWYLIRTQTQVEAIIDSVAQNPGIILFTILEDGLTVTLLKRSAELGVPCISGISHIIRAFAEYLKVPYLKSVGRQHQLDEGYMNRIEAINYTVAHDDGNLCENLADADIILIGASRTSKSPVSIYLGYKGYRVANIPFVSENLMPSNLSQLIKPLIVGLVIDPVRLEEIRRTRVRYMNFTEDSEYTNIEAIETEIVASRKFLNKLSCPIIDVTSKSVEETSVYIMNLLNAKRNKKIVEK